MVLSGRCALQRNKRVKIDRRFASKRNLCQHAPGEWPDRQTRGSQPIADQKTMDTWHSTEQRPDPLPYRTKPDPRLDDACRCKTRRHVERFSKHFRLSGRGDAII